MKLQQAGTVVAELWCNDFQESLRFYTESLGFEIGQHKEGSTHAYLVLGSALIMISGYWRRQSRKATTMRQPSSCAKGYRRTGYYVIGLC